MKVVQVIFLSIFFLMLCTFDVSFAQQEQTKQESAKQKKKQAYELREKKIREGKAPVQKSLQKKREGKAKKLQQKGIIADSLKANKK